MILQNLLEQGSQNVNIVLSQEQFFMLRDYLTNYISEAIKQPEKVPEVPLTRQEAANRLRVTMPTLWRWDKENLLKPHKYGGRRIYLLSDIENFISKGRTGL